MIRSNRLGILQRSNHAAVNARDRDNHRMPNGAKFTEPLRRELFRHSHIVFVNGAKHQYKQRNYYHDNPGAMNELGGNEDT